ncbi:unnamed protein product [Toxocara canis]|uniref:Nuclear pore complex protein n=1 Tax=Toxocara canis TaxID=6265 RepID=A0A183UY08_TOXCA|nr:unnamed protein product [Toxocara canis]
MLVFGRYSRCWRITRGCLRVLRRTLLTERFAMDEEWAARRQTLDTLALGGDYEWIAAVQKKFVGGGIASAVDVDAAVCAAEEKDQLEDLIDLVYRLRHTRNTADTLPSTEYALLRSMLRHDAMHWLFKILADPINYGVFLNEHSACLAIDHLLKAKNFAGAAKVASVVMQQEILTCELLNILSIYAALRWLDLPPEQRVFDASVQPTVAAEEEVNEEEMRTMKFAYLKNAHFDDHFDILDAERLVGKTLLWMVERTSLESNLIRSIQAVGALFFEKFDLLSQLLLGEPLMPAAVDFCRTELQRRVTSAGEESDTKYEQLLEKVEKCSRLETSKSLWSAVEEHLRRIQMEEEKQLIDTQRNLFKEWANRRTALIGAQVSILPSCCFSQISHGSHWNSQINPVRWGRK